MPFSYTRVVSGRMPVRNDARLGIAQRVLAVGAVEAHAAGRQAVDVGRERRPAVAVLDGPAVVRHQQQHVERPPGGRFVVGRPACTPRHSEEDGDADDIHYGSTFTRMLRKQVLLPGSCPCNANVPCGSQVIFVGKTNSPLGVSGTVYSTTVLPLIFVSMCRPWTTTSCVYHSLSLTNVSLVSWTPHRLACAPPVAVALVHLAFQPELREAGFLEPRVDVDAGVRLRKGHHLVRMKF